MTAAVFARETVTGLSILTAPRPDAGGACGSACVEAPPVPPPEQPASSAPAKAKMPAPARARLITHGLDSMLMVLHRLRSAARAGARHPRTPKNLPRSNDICKLASANFFRLRIRIRL